MQAHDAQLDLALQVAVLCDLALLAADEPTEGITTLLGKLAAVARDVKVRTEALHTGTPLRPANTDATLARDLMSLIPEMGGDEDGEEILIAAAARLR